jgi:hypothetical protein
VKETALRSARITINITAVIISVTVKKRSILNKYAAAKNKVFVFSSLLYIEVTVFDVLSDFSSSF